MKFAPRPVQLFPVPSNRSRRSVRTRCYSPPSAPRRSLCTLMTASTGPKISSCASTRHPEPHRQTPWAPENTRPPPSPVACPPATSRPSFLPVSTYPSIDASAALFTTGPMLWFGSPDRPPSSSATRSSQPFHEHVIDRSLNNRPRTCRAFLSAEAERRSRHTLNRGVQVRIRAYQDRILPTHLQNRPLDPDLPGLLSLRPARESPTPLPSNR